MSPGDNLYPGEALVPQYRQMHAHGRFGRPIVLKYANQIASLIGRTSSFKLMDYGCGHASQYYEHRLHEFWGVQMPYLYDPGLPSFDSRAWVGTLFDGVICTDVLEHLPEDDVVAALAEIGEAATAFVFVSVCTRLAKKCLPDGRNCHLTVRPENWWHDLIRATAEAMRLRRGFPLRSWTLRFTP